MSEKNISTSSNTSDNSSSSSDFHASVEKYICLAIDEEDASKLADAVKHLPGTPIKKLHVTIVHSLDAAKRDDAMQMWNKALTLVDHQEEITVTRYKKAPGVLTAAEGTLKVDLAALVASKVPHVSLRLEKGHKAVESRLVIADDAVPWTNLDAPIVLHGVIKLMGGNNNAGQQKKKKKD